MAVYGRTIYGTETYGFDIPPAYRVDPFIAKSVNYSTISVSWSKPSGTILAYRLLKNRFGFPVNQDDGEILIDTATGYPGNGFADTDVVPGTYHYYGFYVLLDFGTNQWVRSGVTSCLAISNYESGLQIHELMPAFYHLQGDEVIGNTVNDFPGEILDAFCLVFGWGMDYLRTQYNTYKHLNDPWFIPLNDLYNLAAELGININPDIHPYTLRKAVYFNATVNHQRGTPSGVSQELDILTGWNADLQIGSNIMLNNDQSNFSDPFYPAWSANLHYNVNELVTFSNIFYKCILANEGNAPTGSNTANTWWTPNTAVVDNTVLKNAATNYPSTWEILYPSAVNGAPSASTLNELIGVSDPLATSNLDANRLRGTNSSGSSATLWIRSVARTIADMLVTTTTFAPNKDQAVADGIPVPFSLPSQAWNNHTRYGTGQIATYSSQPFVALRASTNVVPPYVSIGTVNNEWAPVSLDSRYRICVSAYTIGTSAVPAYPFVEWYDDNGNYITRLIARNPSSGSVAVPDQLYFDSFTAGAGTSVSGRIPDTMLGTWTLRTGGLSVSPYSGGCVYQATAGTRSYATLTSTSADCQVGVTFTTSPQAGQSEGLILRWQDDNNYLRAGTTTLRLKSGGTFSTLGTYSAPFSPGDRMIAQLNGSSIIILRNGVSVLSVTNAFNTTGLTHGIIVENT